MVNAAELFHHVAEWRIVICKACRREVWSGLFCSHSTGKQHRIARKEAIAVSNEVEAWPGVARIRIEVDVPPVVAQPIVEVLLYTDGSRFVRDPKWCSYICRGRTSITNHWRE
jgi:hypothetical protein